MAVNSVIQVFFRLRQAEKFKMERLSLGPLRLNGINESELGNIHTEPAGDNFERGHVQK